MPFFDAETQRRRDAETQSHRRLNDSDVPQERFIFVRHRIEVDHRGIGDVSRWATALFSAALRPPRLRVKTMPPTTRDAVWDGAQNEVDTLKSNQNTPALLVRGT